VLISRRWHREWLWRRRGITQDEVDRFGGHRAIRFVGRDHQLGEQPDFDEELLIVQVRAQRVGHRTRLNSAAPPPWLRMPLAEEHKRSMSNIPGAQSNVMVTNVDCTGKPGNAVD
jgi:hypothetical protein